MNWIELRTEEDVENLMERVEQFHDWYVAAFSIPTTPLHKARTAT